MPCSAPHVDECLPAQLVSERGFGQAENGLQHCQDQADRCVGLCCMQVANDARSPQHVTNRLGEQGQAIDCLRIGVVDKPVELLSMKQRNVRVQQAVAPWGQQAPCWWCCESSKLSLASRQCSSAVFSLRRPPLRCAPQPPAQALPALERRRQRGRGR